MKSLLQHISRIALVSGLVFSLSASAYADSPVVNTIRAAKADATDICEYQALEDAEDIVYDYELISVRKPLQVETDAIFEVKVFVKNTGNTPWFSKNSPCVGDHVSLGTAAERDRQSNFFANDLPGWAGDNRIVLDQERVDPQGFASFTFTAMAPSEDSIFTEYFDLVVEGKQWFEKKPLKMQFIVGEPDLDFETMRRKFTYAKKSGDTDALIDLNAEKRVLVDLSSQMMYVALGEEIIDEFLVSTGAYRTPTPTGRHTILGKNHVRIGGDGPYIMPRFQLLGIRGGRFTGYGIHALPSIGTGSLLREIRSIQARGEEVPHEIYEGNALWTEAVEHLGTPVSHGCIRVAPDQADFLFDYTEVGETELIVERSLDQNRIQEILQEVI